MKKKKTTLDTKLFEVTERKVTEEDGKIYLTGYANTKGHSDSHGDIPTNFNDQPVYILDFMLKNPVCFVDHWASASNIAGNFVELKEDEKGLWFKLLFRDLPDIYNNEVKDAVSAWQKGFGRALSIGGNWLFEDAENPNNLTKAVLREISLVGIGSDHDALTDADYPKHIATKKVVPFTNMPIADRDKAWNPEGAIGRIRELTGAEDDGLEGGAIQRRYRQAFLWYYNIAPEKFESYKLPIADVIDGVLTVVPKAIFAAAGAMRGGRFSIDLPEQDRPSIIRNIEKYYEKMDLESPFNDKSAFRVDDFSAFGEKDLENIFKDGICLSGKKAKAMVSALKSSGLRDVSSDGHRDGDDGLKEIGAILRKTLKTINKGEV